MHSDVLVNRLEKNLIPEPNTGCLLWTAATGNYGYGQIRFNYKIVPTHRLAYEIAKGPIPMGLFVRHKCDTPQCCNPQHLELGTQIENMGDASKRSRIRNQYMDRTHCSKGHEYTFENVRMSNGRRVCKICSRATNRKAYHKRHNND